MIEHIIQTQNNYRVMIDGQEWLVPNTPTNRHWQMVQDAIANGAAITVQQTPTIVIPNLSFVQLLIGLVAECWLTESEANDWTLGILPPVVLALIKTLPTEQQFAASIRAKYPGEIARTDNLVQLLGATQGKTSEELDQFFLTYSKV